MLITRNTVRAHPGIVQRKNSKKAEYTVGRSLRGFYRIPGKEWWPGWVDGDKWHTLVISDIELKFGKKCFRVTNLEILFQSRHGLTL